MTTDLMATVGIPAPGQAPGVSTEHPVGRTRGLVPLLFALNFATALPPAALLFPANGPCPRVRPGSAAVLSAPDLAMLLGRPTIEIGSGRIELSDVDARLGGLDVWLDVFQVS